MKIVRYIGSIAIVLLLVACGSGPEKKKDTPVIETPQTTEQSARIDQIVAFEGTAGLHESTVRMYHYDGAMLTVYDGLTVLKAISVGHAGHFHWSTDGAYLYYIEYRDFIRQGNWLNAGVVKKLSVTDGTTEQIGAYNNVSYFALSADETSMALINLGSVTLLTFEKKATVERKLTNGYAMTVDFAGETLVIYERKEHDSIVVINFKGKVLFSQVLHASPNRWTFPDRVEVLADALRVYSSDGVREFAPLRKPSAMTMTVVAADNETVPERVRIGNGFLEYEAGSNDTKFYFTANGEREFIYTLPATLPMKFFSRDNFIYYMWPKGIAVFSYILE